jgi:hypothetical protein
VLKDYSDTAAMKTQGFTKPMCRVLQQHSRQAQNSVQSCSRKRFRSMPRTITLCQRRGTELCTECHARANVVGERRYPQQDPDVVDCKIWVWLLLRTDARTRGRGSCLIHPCSMQRRCASEPSPLESIDQTSFNNGFSRRPFGSHGAFTFPVAVKLQTVTRSIHSSERRGVTCFSPRLVPSYPYTPLIQSIH